MLVCKFCEQPIYETEQTRGFPGGPLVYMRGKYRHIKDDKWACNEAEINPSNSNYEKPKCHVCGTENTNHDMFCSVSGLPPYHAQLSEKK